MQKRLFGILASIAVIAAACGGATTSTAPPASVAPGDRRHPPRLPHRAVRPSPQEQILRIDVGQRAHDPRPQQGVELRLDIAVLSALHAVLLASTRT